MPEKMNWYPQQKLLDLAFQSIYKDYLPKLKRAM